MLKYLYRDGDENITLVKAVKRQLSEWSTETKLARKQYAYKDFKILSKWIGNYHRGMFFQPLLSKDTTDITLIKSHRPVRITFRKNQSDLYILRENFVHNIYDFEYEKFLPEVSYILDLGANIGLSSLYFQMRFQNAQIICVEPVQENIEILKQNAYINNFSWEVEKAAIQAKQAEVILYPNEWWSSSTVTKSVANKRESHTGRFEHKLKLTPKKIKGLTVSNILDKYQIATADILKMDIEGAEEQCILDSPQWLRRVKVLIIEIHEKYVNRNKITTALAKNGFTMMSGRSGPTDVFINEEVLNYA